MKLRKQLVVLAGSSAPKQVLDGEGMPKVRHAPNLELPCAVHRPPSSCSCSLHASEQRACQGLPCPVQ